MDLLIIAVLILMNGVLAMSELAVVSSRKARLRQLADAGDPRAGAALTLSEHPGPFLSTVQIGITAVGILAGAFGEATLARDLAQWVAQWPLLAPHSQAVALAIVVTVVTYLSVVVGELVPKQIALHNPERIARWVAPPMRALARAAKPLVWTLSASSAVLLRLLGSRPRAEEAVSEEDIRRMIRIGAQAGVLEKTEHDLVKNVFRLDDRSVTSLMTPRAQIVFLDLEAGDAAARKVLASGVHARYPVCRGGLDNLVGVVSARKLLARALAGAPLDVAAAARPAFTVPPWLSGIDLLEQFRRHGATLALVVEPSGEVLGMVTQHDVLEAIVGGIAPGEPPPWTRRKDGSWLVDGMVFVDEVKDRLGLRRLPEEDTAEYETLGGLVMAAIGRLPEVADTFEWEGWRFEVVDMDGKRVDRVLITPPEAHAAASPDAA